MIPTFVQKCILCKVDALVTPCRRSGAGSTATATRRRLLKAPLAEREMEVIQ